jgi:quinol monooxygenase YgiN
MSDPSDPAVDAGDDRAVVVAGWIDYDPADRDAALAAFADVVAASRQEPGCIDYAFTPDPDHPGRVRVFEHWVSDAALTEHLTLPHVQALRGAIAGLSRTGRQMTHLTVAASRPMGSASPPAATT